MFNLNELYIDETDKMENKKIAKVGWIDSGEKMYIIFKDSTFTILMGQTSYESDEVDFLSYNSMLYHLHQYNYEFAKLLGEYTDFDSDAYITWKNEEKYKKDEEYRKKKEDQEYAKYLELQEKFKNRKDDM